MRSVESQQVHWWPVHEFVTACLDEAGVVSFPLLGTPTWCALPAHDERKLAALFDAAQHWALRMETCQAARAEAGSDVAAAADWSRVAFEMRTLEEFRRDRPWMKRVSA